MACSVFWLKLISEAGETRSVYAASPTAGDWAIESAPAGERGSGRMAARQSQGQLQLRFSG
jgi:hypothetical protein